MWDQKNDLDTSRVLSGIRVLLVEDEPDIADLLIFVLETAGAEVLSFEYAKLALESCESLYPDILLCNIRLPIEDGYWLIQQIRIHSCMALRQLPAIALTSYRTDLTSL